MQDAAIPAALAENKRLAESLKVRGVPFYIVGDKVLREGKGDFYADLTSMVAEARGSQPKTE
jgi:protein-disulfide isomerase